MPPSVHVTYNVYGNIIVLGLPLHFSFQFYLCSVPKFSGYFNPTPCKYSIGKFVVLFFDR